MSRAKALADVVHIVELEKQVAHCNENHSEPFACHCQTEGGWLCADASRLIYLEEALRFYANPDVYKVYMGDDPVIGPGHYPTFSEIDRDRGTRARTALGLK